MGRNKKDFEMNRRDFIRNLLVGSGCASFTPLNLFVGNILGNFLQRAEALAAGDEMGAFSDKKFISLILAGGAPRYYWDLLLKPNGNDLFHDNKMVITRFDEASTGKYATTQIGKYHFPHLWSSRIPTVSGSVPMSTLLSNFLTIRGIDLQIDSHELDLQRQITPVLGGVSLNGLLADRSELPIPASGRNGNVGGYYRSRLGKAYNELKGDSPLDEVISNFKHSGNLISMSNSEVDKAIDAALVAMAESAGENNKYLPYTYQARLNAKKVMKTSFGDLRAVYTQLTSKYNSLVGRAFASQGNLSLAGVDVNLAGVAGNELFRRESGQFFTAPLSQITDENTRISQMSEAMAVSEFMIKNNLSSTLNCVVGDIVSAKAGQTGNVHYRDFPVDAHETGSNVSLVIFSRYYKAVSACLYELRQQLIEEDLFNTTVIGVCSEFNRRPRSTGFGSDHGWQGSNYTIMSGMIQGTQIVGNIRSNDPHPSYKGTWGLAAPYLDGKETRIGNVASTVAQMLDIESPTPEDKSLVNASFIPLLNECKNT